MDNSMLYADQVSFAYKKHEENEEYVALDEINLNVLMGEFLVVIGHNGSGKSTLAKHFNAILMPSKGQVIVDGIDTKNSEQLWEIRQRAGMVFQNPDNQIVATIVEEDVAFGPENIGLRSDTIRARIDAAMTLMGIAKFAKRSPHMLSGGQKHRVAIAGALALEPECIVLDEPTSMLDPKGRYDVLESLLRLKRDKGTTLVLITHFMTEAILADRVGCTPFVISTFEKTAFSDTLLSWAQTPSPT
jgi:energy-coupling factor transport system ATP-binding protein